MFYFYTPWKLQKTFVFLKFAGGGGGIEMEYWTKIVKQNSQWRFQNKICNCCNKSNLSRFVQLSLLALRWTDRNIGYFT